MAARIVVTGSSGYLGGALVARLRAIYDLTKLEAERVVVSSVGPTLETVILRVGRCFVEPWRTTVVNRLHRGVDLRDVVDAFERSMTAPVVAPVTLNIAGPRIFDRSDLHRLRSAPSSVLADRAPGIVEEFRRRDWVLPATIDRVYVSDLASNVIGYRPRYDVWDALSSDPGADASGQPAARARVPR